MEIETDRNISGTW